MRVLAVYTILLASCSIAAQIQRPDVNAVLSTRVTRFHLDAANLLEAAAHISSTFNLPMGIAWQGPASENKKIAGDWVNTTVGEVLKDAIAEDPAYRVEIANGIVHIRPAGYEKNSSNFLNIRLPSFSANDYTHVVGMQLRDRLNRMLVSQPAKPSAEACGGSIGIGAQEVRTIVEVVNTPVEQILDLLLLHSRYQMWLVIFEPDTTYGGYFGTASIYRKTSDWDQPNWDFLVRYYDPVERKEHRDWEVNP